MYFSFLFFSEDALISLPVSGGYPFLKLTFDSILGQHEPVRMSLDYIQCKNQNPEKRRKS